MDTGNLMENEPIMEPSANKWWLLTNEEDRIVMVTSEKQNDDQFEFELPENFDISTHNNYKVVDGELVYDEVILPEVKPQPSLQEQVDELNATIDTLVTEVIPTLMANSEESEATE